MTRSVSGLILMIALAGAEALAEPNSQINSAIYSVSYQCAGEAPQIFQYAGARNIPLSNEVKLETQWYWNRVRTDRGAGCRILAVDGTPYRD